MNQIALVCEWMAEATEIEKRRQRTHDAFLFTNIQSMPKERDGKLSLCDFGYKKKEDL